MQNFQILSDDLLKRFERGVKSSVKTCFQKLSEKEFTLNDFTNYITAGAVASSQIEGSTLDLNSFYQSKANKINAKEVAEIEDLLKAYEYSKNHTLSQKSLLVCHGLLSKSFTNITRKQKGKYRQAMVGIHGWNGLVYVAVEAENIATEMNKLFADISMLLDEKLTLKQTLYYAGFIHFLFAKIHPFADGNGRAARLLEKWFLVSVLGDAVWSVPSEKYYYDNRAAYYNGLNIGINYYESLERIDNILPFLKLLPEAVCYTPVG